MPTGTKALTKEVYVVGESAGEASSESEAMKKANYYATTAIKMA